VENADYKPTKGSHGRSVSIVLTREDHERRLAVVSEIVCRFVVGGA
jgi:hypothetical protein